MRDKDWSGSHFKCYTKFIMFLCVNLDEILDLASLKEMFHLPKIIFLNMVLRMQIYEFFVLYFRMNCFHMAAMNEVLLACDAMC